MVRFSYLWRVVFFVIPVISKSHKVSDIMQNFFRLVREENISRTAAAEQLLYNATKAGNSILFRLLLHHAKNLDKPQTHKTYLMIALEEKNIYFVNSLLMRGASITACDNRGRTPLHYAVMHQCYEGALELLKRKADSNIPDRAGLTPLGRAAMDGDAHMCQLLLEYGANIPPVTPGEMSTYDLCCYMEKHSRAPSRYRETKSILQQFMNRKLTLLKTKYPRLTRKN